MSINLCCAALAVVLAYAAVAREFYFSPNGNDGHSGHSADQAWKSLSLLEKTELAPGDKILLKGGATISGNLVFKKGGSKNSPIVISSYGEGRATLDAGKGFGIKIYNCAGFTISNLTIQGDGRESNTGSGIECYCDLPGDVKIEHIRIEEVEAFGFGRNGIEIGAYSGKSGFKNIRIVNCSAHDNQLAGINSWGNSELKGEGWSHADLRVAWCKAFNNSGNPAKLDNHSGSGIVIGGVEDALIEYCEAYNNGWLCNCKIGGPVGIWLWDTCRGVIQYCESHHNKTGAPSTDGGGFDLDGGAIHCVMQCNWSHDNDGPGYLLAQYKGARPFHHNTVRFNISQNDCRQHNVGSIQVWSDIADDLTDCDIYNNTVYLSASKAGTPAALRLQSKVKVRIVNNIFIKQGEVPLARSDANGAGTLLEGNCYFAEDGKMKFQYLKDSFTEQQAWREKTNFENSGSANFDNPKLIGAGRGETIGNPKNLVELTVYKLSKDSPLLGKGMDLRKDLQIDPGRFDYFGRQLPKEGPLNAGAAITELGNEKVE